MFDLTLSLTPAGTKIYAEYGNEMWNTSSTSNIYGYCATRAIMANKAAGSTVFNNGQEWYTYRSIQLHDLARARATAAGRSTSDIVGVLGAQAGYAAFTTNIYCAYALANGLTFDAVAIDTYQDLAPIQGVLTTTGASLNDFADRLDTSGRVDFYYMMATDSERDLLGAGHKSQFTGTLAGVKLISYEGGPAQLALYGSNTLDSTSKMAQELARHYRFFSANRSWLQYLDVTCGYALYCRYAADLTSAASGSDVWVDQVSIFQDVGTGTLTENANPWDMPTLLSQLGGSMRAYAALSMSASHGFVCEFFAGGFLEMGF